MKVVTTAKQSQAKENALLCWCATINTRSVSEKCFHIAKKFKNISNDEIIAKQMREFKMLQYYVLLM